jgi:acyl-CoA reductase-like NAD-dependent aldehyde dehydrogenase
MNTTMTGPNRKNCALETHAAALPGNTSWSAVSTLRRTMGSRVMNTAPNSVGELTGQLVVEVPDRHGAPAGLVQWVKGRSGREVTIQFMRHPDVAFILATGGMNMVRAAYSSGTPAIGVGPGNAPTWVCADADLDLVASSVVASKSFDYGVVCASEHNLVVDRPRQPA